MENATGSSGNYFFGFILKCRGLNLSGPPPLFSVLVALTWRQVLLQVRAALCQRQAVTVRLFLRVLLRAALSSDRIQQRHDNSLAGLLESCYQVLDFPEISFLHTRSGLKHKKEVEEEGGGKKKVFSFFISTSNPHGETKSAGQQRLEMSFCRFYPIKDIRYAKSRGRNTSTVGKWMGWESRPLYFYISSPLSRTELIFKDK